MSNINIGVSPKAGADQLLLIVSALALIIIWGTAFNMVSIGVRYMSPLWLVAGRLVISVIVVGAYVLLSGLKPPPLTDKRWLYYGALGQSGMVIPFFLTSQAQRTIDSGLSAILVGVMPLMTIVLAHFYVSEPLTRRKLLGFTLGFIGTVILFMPEQLSLSLIADWRAQMLSVLAALFYAVTTVGAKRAPPTPSAVGAAMMLTSAAIVAVIAALILDGPLVMPAPTGLLMVGLLGLGASGLATILYLYVVARFGPTVVAKINYFPPFVSVLVGILFMQELFSLRIASAFALIMFGVWIARNPAKAAKLPGAP